MQQPVPQMVTRRNFELLRIGRPVGGVVVSGCSVGSMCRNSPHLAGSPRQSREAALCLARGGTLVH